MLQEMQKTAGKRQADPGRRLTDAGKPPADSGRQQADPGKQQPAANKRQTGARYETLAASYLERRGMRILVRNFRARNGEIDLVAQDDEYLVFVEVKYRSSGVAGTGAEAVDRRKQKTICRISDYYRTRFGIKESTPVRYDVVECALDEREEIRVIWYKNAFLYCR